MKKLITFQMWEPYRRFLIQNHFFYLEQAQKRLLSQFEKIDEEATQAADKWLEASDQYFDPDHDDAGSFYERSEGVAIEFYTLLSAMQEQTRLSVVAGLFHEWDKKLREWLAKEIHFWHGGGRVVQKIWSVNFDQIMDFLECLNWQVRSAAYYNKLDACRFVVNAYKHGEGEALQVLKNKFPEYLNDPLKRDVVCLSDTKHRKYTDLRVNDKQISEFSDAIIEFWKDVPGEVSNTDMDQSKFPSWFSKAYNADNQQTRTS